jgi:hypothetical protein
MKIFRLLIIAVCFSVMFALFNGVVSALDQDEARVSVAWSSQTPNRGSNVTVTILLINDVSEELTIYYLGLHVDWMTSGTFIGVDISDDPVIIPSSGSHNFPPMTILIPEDASVGTHSYFVGIDGLQGESTTFSWDSLTLTLVIQKSEEEVYNELMTKIASNITDAVNSKYQSSKAQSLLGQAENSYDQALSVANQGNWEKAISALQNASTYIEQADVEEQQYVEAKSQQDLLLIIVGVVVVVVVTVLIIILMIWRKRKQIAPVDQPTEV